ncbi:MAG: ribonuclease J, partial [Actinomycetota bacterium]
MTSRTKIIFLGGVGEIGRNMTLFEHDGKILIVDVGLMFPTEDMLGVDLVLPDFEYVVSRAKSVVGILLTHGHEDHVGGVPYLLREMNPPIYGSRLTIGLLKPKLEEHHLLDKAKLREIKTPGRLTIGPFKLRCFATAHSIPDALSTIITTEAGTILHTGDFKLDRTPGGGKPTDLKGLAQMAASGIDVMLGDSTNADRPGHTPSEKVVSDALSDVIRRATGRVVIACFASNIHRVQQAVDAARDHGRMVAFIGRSMKNNVRVSKELGYLEFPDAMHIPLEDIDSFPPENVLIVCTGSQGEPFAALSRMAARDHKQIKLNSTDTVVLSATPIPGNESAVRRVTDGLFRIGANVIQPPEYPVHVSGHASADDLKLILELVGPKWFVPVHGEYRHLATHARLAHEVGIAKDRTIVVEDGDVLEMSRGRLKKLDRIHAGYVLVDGLGIGDVGDVVLRDRRLLADDGFVVCVVTVDSQTGELLAGPDI